MVAAEHRLNYKRLWRPVHSKQAGGMHAFTRGAVLFAPWKTWCEARNVATGSAKALSEDLVDRGYVKKRDGAGQRGFRNLVVRDQ